MAFQHGLEFLREQSQPPDALRELLVRRRIGTFVSLPDGKIAMLTLTKRPLGHYRNIASDPRAPESTDLLVTRISTEGRVLAGRRRAEDAMDPVCDRTVKAVHDQIDDRFDAEREKQAFIDQPLVVLGHKSPREVLLQKDHYEVMKLSVLLSVHASGGRLRGVPKGSQSAPMETAREGAVHCQITSTPVVSRHA